MKEQKHIDRIFREKLKNFEAQPQARVWDGIQAELHNNKKDRKLIPFWWKLGGVAAGLMLMLGVSYTIYNSTNNQPDIIVDQNQIIIDSKENKPSNNNNQNNQLVFEPANAEADKSSKEEQQTDTSTNLNPITSNSTEKNILKSKSNRDNIVTNASNTAKSAKQDALVATNKNEKQPLNKHKSSEKSTSNIVQETINNEKTAVALEHVDKLNEENKTQEIVQQKNQTSRIADQSVLKTDDEKIEDDFKETLPTEKTIEEAIAEAENITNEEEKENLNRWRVSPNVAPVYFNSLGEGSSIHSQFNENNKSTNVNISYGIAASYALNKKLKLRAGVSNVAFDYRTNGILTSDASSRTSVNDASNIANITFNQNAVATNYLSSKAVILSSAPDIVKTGDYSSLEQQFGFIEVPVELEYSLVDKKLGLNVIGGFSTFFLNNNSVYQVTDGNSILVGEANNINNVSYSANFGLGMFYNVSKTLQFNFEPMFKYQINTFSNTFGDFQPFFVGVYTGLSFKF